MNMVTTKTTTADLLPSSLVNLAETTFGKIQQPGRHHRQKQVERNDHPDP